MARKTDGTTTSRKKKATPLTETAVVQAAPEQQIAPEVRSAEVRSPEIRSTEVRGNVTPINVAPTKPAAKKSGNVNLDHVNLDEEIRRRAYELFLERQGTPGDPMADWVVAEREIRARHDRKESAFAATQGS